MSGRATFMLIVVSVFLVLSFSQQAAVAFSPSNKEPEESLIKFSQFMFGTTAVLMGLFALAVFNKGFQGFVFGQNS